MPTVFLDPDGTHDPSFRGLRNDAAFEALLVEVEAAWAASLPLLRQTA